MLWMRVYVRRSLAQLRAGWLVQPRHDRLAGASVRKPEGRPRESNAGMGRLPTWPRHRSGLSLRLGQPTVRPTPHRLRGSLRRSTRPRHGRLHSDCQPAPTRFYRTSNGRALQRHHARVHCFQEQPQGVHVGGQTLHVASPANTTSPMRSPEVEAARRSTVRLAKSNRAKPTSSSSCCCSRPPISCRPLRIRPLGAGCPFGIKPSHHECRKGHAHERNFHVGMKMRYPETLSMRPASANIWMASWRQRKKPAMASVSTPSRPARAQIQLYPG